MRRHRRRGFAAACLALAFFVAACPSHPKASPTPSASASGPARHSGTLVVAYPNEPSTLNPYVRGGDAPATRDLVRPLYPSLYRLGPGGARTLSLLASEPQVEVGPPFAVRLTLRSDEKWSDGAPVLASDLRFTWRTLVDPHNAVVSHDGYDQISDVAVDSAIAARIVFKRPFARWKDLFWAVLPEHALKGKPFASALSARIAATGGPFRLHSWNRGLEITYDRDPAWTPSASLDRIVVRFVPDVVTALQLLERGRVDALGPYEGIDLARRAALIRGATTNADRGPTWAGLWFGTRSSILSDVRVRRALAYAIDRDAIVTGLVRDSGAPLNGLAPGDRADPFRSYVHDLDRARSILADAGWTGSGIRRRGGRALSVTVACIGSDELPDRVLRALHAQAERAGIDLNVVDLDSTELWRDWLYGSRFEAAFVIARGTALRALFESNRRPPAGENVFGLTDRTLDAELRAADAGESPVAAEITRTEQRLAELVPAIPLYQDGVVLVVAGHAVGLRANASVDGFLWNAEQWSRR